MLRALLLALQVLQVAFLWLHDWLPLGSLNDVRAVRAADSFGRLVVVTLIQSLPFTVLLLLCVAYTGQPYPHWLVFALWVAYIALLGATAFAIPLWVALWRYAFRSPGVWRESSTAA